MLPFISYSLALSLPPVPPCLCSQNVFSDVLWDVPYLSPKIAPRYSKEEGWPPPGIVALSIGKSMQVRLRTICRSDGTTTFYEWSPDFFALDKALKDYLSDDLRVHLLIIIPRRRLMYLRALKMHSPRQSRKFSRSDIRRAFKPRHHLRRLAEHPTSFPREP